MLISSENFLPDVIQIIIIICCLFHFLFKEIDKNKRKLNQSKNKIHFHVYCFKAIFLSMICRLNH